MRFRLVTRPFLSSTLAWNRPERPSWSHPGHQCFNYSEEICCQVWLQRDGDYTFMSWSCCRVWFKRMVYATRHCAANVRVKSFQERTSVVESADLHRCKVSYRKSVFTFLWGEDVRTVLSPGTLGMLLRMRSYSQLPTLYRLLTPQANNMHKWCWLRLAFWYVW